MMRQRQWSCAGVQTEIRLACLYTITMVPCRNNNNNMCLILYPLLPAALIIEGKFLYMHSLRCSRGLCKCKTKSPIKTCTLEQTVPSEAAIAKEKSLWLVKQFAAGSREERRRKYSPRAPASLFIFYPQHCGCQKSPTTSMQSGAMELTPAGSDVLIDSWRKEGAHPLTHLWFQQIERGELVLLRRTPPKQMQTSWGQTVNAANKLKHRLPLRNLPDLDSWLACSLLKYLHNVLTWPTINFQTSSL